MSNARNLFSHIQNGQKNRLFVIGYARSKMTISILKILQENGYIRGYRLGQPDSSIEKKNSKKPGVQILLRYKNQTPAIGGAIQVSKSSKRIYISVKDLTSLQKTENEPTNSDLWSFFFMRGISIISTSKGVLSNIEAYKLNVGGEYLAQVW